MNGKPSRILLTNEKLKSVEVIQDDDCSFSEGDTESTESLCTIKTIKNKNIQNEVKGQSTHSDTNSMHHKVTHDNRIHSYVQH